MSDPAAALRTVVARVDELAHAGEALAAAYRELGAASDDVDVIIQQTRKSTNTTSDVERALAAGDRAEVAMLVHRLNNHLTGALSIASLAREEATQAKAIDVLQAVERAGRAAAESVRNLSEALKGA